MLCVEVRCVEGGMFETTTSQLSPHTSLVKFQTKLLLLSVRGRMESVGSRERQASAQGVCENVKRSPVFHPSADLHWLAKSP